MKFGYYIISVELFSGTNLTCRARIICSSVRSFFGEERERAKGWVRESFRLKSFANISDCARKNTFAFHLFVVEYVVHPLDNIQQKWRSRMRNCLLTRIMCCLYRFFFVISANFICKFSLRWDQIPLKCCGNTVKLLIGFLLSCWVPFVFPYFHSDLSTAWAFFTIFIAYN